MKNSVWDRLRNIFHGLPMLPEDIYFERHMQIINGGCMNKAEQFIKQVSEGITLPEWTKQVIELCKHIDAMADDAYLVGHPEWEEIANEAAKVRADFDIVQPVKR